MNLSEHRRPNLRRLAIVALAITVAWIIAGVFFATQHIVMIEARGDHDNPVARFSAMLISMLVWACLTPIVLHIADLFPLRKSRRLRSTAILIPILLALAAARASVDSVLPFVLEGMPMTIADYRSSCLSLFHTHLFFAMLLVGIGNFMRLQREEGEQRRVEARAQAELAQARLGRLRADLHPHFLFNALNSVAAVVHTNPAAARSMLQQLTELLERSLASRDVREVALAEELDLTRSYLGVVQMRFGERLTATMELQDDALRDAALPPLLLQPLVENAIVHGIAHRLDARVTVKVDREQSWLRMQVRDNGSGCAPEAVSRREGVGISNVRARLESAYGERQSLRFFRDGEHFVAEIRIPLQPLDALSRTA